MIGYAAATTTEYKLSSPRAGLVASELESLLHDLAREIIVDCPENQRFLINPDEVEEHHVDWHQYGIITHTIKVREALHQELMPQLKQWGMDRQALESLSTETRSGWTRGELLEVSVPLHDLGKFARKHTVINGRITPDYSGHEALSEAIVLRDPKLQIVFEKYGLKKEDVNHLAALAGLHFELGKVRDAAKCAGGFTMAFANSLEARNVFE